MINDAYKRSLQAVYNGINIALKSGKETDPRVKAARRTKQRLTPGQAQHQR